jgi:MauM/NapG family ferredoxin protein
MKGPTRRTILISAVLLGGGVIGVRRRSEAVLRPPGAVADFEATCIRCQRCAEVCPPKAILAHQSLDPRLADTPVLQPRARPCSLCMRCTAVCPTGALQPIEPELEQIQRQVRIGRPLLDRDRCVALDGSGECRACYYVCPFRGSAVRLEGPLLGPVFDASACVGCGLCEEACPERARAIRIVPLERQA